MFITTIDKFTEFVPTALGSEYEAIKPYLQISEDNLELQFLGKDFIAYMSTVPDGILKRNFLALICYNAYYNAIPNVDLIQTNNGFAIVSNTNQAPASKERVERLIERCRVLTQNFKDELILSILNTPNAFTEWKKWNGFENYTSCIFLTGYDLCIHISQRETAKRDELDKLRSEIVQYQKTMIEPLISKQYFEQIITSMRNNSLSGLDEKMLNSCKTLIGLQLKGDFKLLKIFSDYISSDMDKNLNDYPLYAGSDEYALKNTPKYQNKLDDPTFFSA